MKRFVIACALWIGWVAQGVSSPAPAVEFIANYKGPGQINGDVIGPGPTPGSERLYLSYMYFDHTVDLVEVDPDTGKWQLFENPAPSEFGAVALVGPDGDIYLGTRPGAHLFQLNPRTGVYKDLGKPALSEQYIWQLAAGSDGKIYGCTYPSSKLVRYDPASGKTEDLGRMDPKELYGRWIAASSDGFIYIGIGTAHAHLVAYRISTGEHRDLLLAVNREIHNESGIGNTALVHQGDDGKIYALVGKQNFRIEGWKIEPIPAAQARPARPTNLLKDGRSVEVDGNQVVVTNLQTRHAERHPYTYPGREGVIFRLADGPDGRIYGSSILPLHFFGADVSTKKLVDFGYLGGGELYSLLSFGNKLGLAAYAGMDETPLMIFDPSRPFKPGKDSASNPLLVTYPGANEGWRPQAMIAGPGHKIYLGSVAGYGSIQGPLTIWDPKTNQIQKLNNIVPDESVVSLAASGRLVIGGTTIFGGGGSHPTQHEAKLFIWDSRQGKKIYETVPVPGATGMTDLLALPKGKIIGIANHHGGPTLFEFNLKSRRVDYTIPLEFKKVIYNSVALGPDGSIWGLTGEGIFRFDPRTRQVTLTKTPKPVTAGFALFQGSIYYAAGPSIYRYRLPANP